MLADVRPLRADGERLKRDQIKSTPPKRGELVVFKRQDPWNGCWVPVASLLEADGQTYVLPVLDQVRIARWKGPDLVLIGLEQHRRSASVLPTLQAWWVRLVSDPALPRTPPPATAE